jgi:hypothetical protein
VRRLTRRNGENGLNWATGAFGVVGADGNFNERTGSVSITSNARPTLCVSWYCGAYAIKKELTTLPLLYLPMTNDKKSCAVVLPRSQRFYERDASGHYANGSFFNTHRMLQQEVSKTYCGESRFCPERLFENGAGYRSL